MTVIQRRETIGLVQGVTGSERSRLLLGVNRRKVGQGLVPTMMALQKESKGEDADGYEDSHIDVSGDAAFQEHHGVDEGGVESMLGRIRSWMKERVKMVRGRVTCTTHLTESLRTEFPLAAAFSRPSGSCKAEIELASLKRDHHSLLDSLCALLVAPQLYSNSAIAPLRYPTGRAQANQSYTTYALLAPRHHEMLDIGIDVAH